MQGRGRKRKSFCVPRLCVIEAGGGSGRREYEGLRVSSSSGSNSYCSNSVVVFTVSRSEQEIDA